MNSSRLKQGRVGLWLVGDRRTGHRRQLESLSLAMARHCALDCHWLEPLAAWRRWAGRLPRPPFAADLVVGCGRRTYRTALALARRGGAMSVALMNARLLRGRFDLSVIPRHDGIAAGKRVLVTEGVLSPMAPGVHRDSGAGMMLIGGPAEGCQWDSAGVWKQLRAIVERHPINWTLTTSRRTPDGFLREAPDTVAAHVRLVDGTTSEPDWLIRELSQCAVAWVTEDSSSMLYDALSAGASTGVLRLPRRGNGRVARGVQDLLEREWVTGFEQWESGRRLKPPPRPLQEADRVARVILARLGYA